MSRVLVTGSADGLGRMAAQLLVRAGHAVVLHARNEQRAAQALRAVPGAESAVSGDLSTLAGMREAARQANASGRFDAVIHNAAVGYTKPRPVVTADGLEQHFAVNVLAPYVLTALIERPDRLVYLSSGMHLSGSADLTDPHWRQRRWSGTQAYCDSKLQITALALHVARRWPNVLSNAVDPGWVATKMGGAGAPGDLVSGALTQVWLATGDDAEARSTGGYFYHQRPSELHPAARNPEYGRRLADLCAASSGIELSE